MRCASINPLNTRFFDNVGPRFDSFKKNIMRCSNINKIPFNEDIFMDTYLKCCNTLKGKDMTEEQIIQYYWTSYVNNTKKEYRKLKYNSNEDDMEEAFGIIDEPYDDRRFKVYDIIISYVKENFPKEYKMWYLHFAENKSYNELIEMGYTNINFHNIFRNINNHVKNNLPKENKEYKKIIKEIFRRKTLSKK